MVRSCVQAFGAAAAVGGGAEFEGAALGGAPGRRLQDAEGPVVSIVETMDELITALEQGAAHIELRAHLDATSFPLIPAIIRNSQFKHLLPPQLGRTRSIRVCPPPPPHA